LNHKAKLRALEEFPPVCHKVHKENVLLEHFHTVTNANLHQCKNLLASCFDFWGLFDVCLKRANHRKPMVVSKLLWQIYTSKIFI